MCLGSVAPHAAEAVRAVDRLAVGRPEGHLRVLAAVRAGRIEHLARGAAAVSTAAATTAVPAGGVASATAVPGVIAAAARVRAAAAISTAVTRARRLSAGTARGAPAG